MIRQFGGVVKSLWMDVCQQNLNHGVGAPQTVVMVTNINTITAVIEEYRHLTVRALAEALHMTPRAKIMSL